MDKAINEKLGINIKEIIIDMEADENRKKTLDFNERVKFRNCGDKDYVAPHKMKNNKQRIRNHG